MPEKRPLPPPDECANCGTEIPRTAKACPECGADERSGWREQDVYDDLDLPEEAFEDEASEARKRKHAATPRVNGIAWYWWLVAIALAVLITLYALRVIGPPIF
jgi:hypothetical protein